MIRSACVVIALAVSSFLVGCTADAEDPTPNTQEESVPAVKTDEVETKVTRCPLPKKRPPTCEVWTCSEGPTGCPPVCGCTLWF